MKSMTTNMLRALAAALLMGVLAGCASVPPQLQSTTTSFGDPAFRPGGKLAVIAADAAQNDGLEFSYFRQLIADRLAATGYEIVRDLAVADHVAIVSYGVDGGRSRLVAVPVYGHYGGGTSYITRTYSDGGQLRTHVRPVYTMPQFGIVGSSSESVTTYGRALAIDIVDGASFRQNAARRLLEIRTHSDGGCNTMAAVLPTMVQAAFAVFPGEFGKPRVDRRPLPPDFGC